MITALTEIKKDNPQLCLSPLREFVRMSPLRAFQKRAVAKQRRYSKNPENEMPPTDKGKLDRII